MAFRIIQPNYISGGGGSPLLTGLVSWWSLESDGTDSHGSNNLTGVGTPSHVAAHLGNGFDNDATMDYYILDGSQTGLDITGSISIACWVNLENDGVNNVMGIAAKYWAATDRRSYQFTMDCRGSDRKFNIILSSDGTTTEEFKASTDISLSTWTCGVVTWDSSSQEIKIYINGSTTGGVDSTTTLSSLYDATLTPFALGARRKDASTAGEQFNGIIDEVAVWNRALTPSEVAEYYNSGTGVSYSSL